MKKIDFYKHKYEILLNKNYDSLTNKDKFRIIVYREFIDKANIAYNKNISDNGDLIIETITHLETVADQVEDVMKSLYSVSGNALDVVWATAFFHDYARAYQLGVLGERNDYAAFINSETKEPNILNIILDNHKIVSGKFENHGELGASLINALDFNSLELTGINFEYLNIIKDIISRVANDHVLYENSKYCLTNSNNI